MKNYLLTLMYNGTPYHGWQVQDNAITVQQVLQDAIEQILSVREAIVGCSRTDSGVHANMFCCNMRTEKVIIPDKFVKSLNAVLPESIAVLGCGEVPYTFHARYDCSSKEYKYLILNSKYRNPFYSDRALFYPFPLDAEVLNKEAQSFLGIHDFTSFCASNSSVEDKTREIKNISVMRNNDLIEITVEANGFLYNMVRIIVGTILDISSGKLQSGSIPAIIEAKDRTLAGKTAPAYGLYLNKVNYN